MRLSELFTKTRKDAPKDEVARNAKLLIRAGYVDKLSAGVYTYLPLGLRVLENISSVIREEMQSVGGQELLMPSLHPKENWLATSRWNTMDDLYKVRDSAGRESALAPTHEEVIVPLARQFVSSHKDLPLALFQIQNKFRMELRAKSGLLRGREFIMKDLYSFHADEKDLARYYATVRDAYLRIFHRLGIGEKTYLTYASGGTFSKYSHEFQTVTPAGEDTIFICRECAVAINQEIAGDEPKCPKCEASGLTEERAIEVGNIFELKTKFSDAFGLAYKGENGKEHPVVMGCYGIGLGRLMGAIVEVHADERGVLWPESVAPYAHHLILLGRDDEESAAARAAADKLYDDLAARGVPVLYDDRVDRSPGVKFADADLIGIPSQIIISDRTVEQGNIAEKRDRRTGKAKDVPVADILP